MRQFDPELAVPYWDTTLDATLPDPTHSILFTEDFLGTNSKNNFLHDYLNISVDVDTKPFDRWYTPSLQNKSLDGKINHVYVSILKIINIKNIFLCPYMRDREISGTVNRLTCGLF